METKAIVIGGNHHNTLGLIRGLGRKGVMSHVILHGNSSSNNYILRSKYIKRYFIVSTEVELLDTLLSLKSNNRKDVILCTSDYASSIIDLHRNKLKDFFFLPGCDEEGRLTYYMNKDVMSSTAKECGLNIPDSWVLNRNQNHIPQITFPCITKPLKSIDGSKSDITICQNENELLLYLKQLSTESVQIQKFINKTVEYQLIGVAADKVVIPGKSLIISQPLCTNTGYLKYVHLDGTEPIRQCEEFLKKIGYSGLFSMEFIRDDKGKDYFMEINFRNDGNAICVTEAGVNLPFIWYSVCCNKDLLREVQTEINREVYVVPEFNEINLWYRGNISFKRMINELRQADVCMEYSVDDPRPTHGKFDFVKLFLISISKRIVKTIIRK